MKSFLDPQLHGLRAIPDQNAAISHGKGALQVT